MVVDKYIKSFFLVERLIRSGRKRIVYLAGPDEVYNSHERGRGYRDALLKFGLEYEKNRIVNGGLTFRDGQEAVENSYSATYLLMPFLPSRIL